MSEFDKLREKMITSKPGGGKPNQFPPFHPVHSGERPESKKEDVADIDWEHVLKRVSLFMGVFLALISVYFSYDGFDNSIAGGNVNYTWYAKVIGVTLAVAVTILQFVFSSSYDKLNLTLKVFGLASYAYSMWSNFQGITHILQMDRNMAIVATLFMDGVPEPLIAWALGASLRGDFMSNALRSIGSIFGSIFIKRRRHS